MLWYLLASNLQAPVRAGVVRAMTPPSHVRGTDSRALPATSQAFVTAARDGAHTVAPHATSPLSSGSNSRPSEIFLGTMLGDDVDEGVGTKGGRQQGWEGDWQEADKLSNAGAGRIARGSPRSHVVVSGGAVVGQLPRRHGTSEVSLVSAVDEWVDDGSCALDCL